MFALLILFQILCMNCIRLEYDSQQGEKNTWRMCQRNKLTRYRLPTNFVNLYRRAEIFWIRQLTTHLYRGLCVPRIFSMPQALWLNTAVFGQWRDPHSFFSSLTFSPIRGNVNQIGIMITYCHFFCFLKAVKRECTILFLYWIFDLVNLATIHW